MEEKKQGSNKQKFNDYPQKIDDVFLNTVRNINRHIFDENDLQITETLLYGDSSLDDKSNTLILNATVYFLFVTKRFDINLL